MGNLLTVSNTGHPTGLQLITVLQKVKYASTSGQYYALEPSQKHVNQYLVTEWCAPGYTTHLVPITDMWDTVQAPYWIAKTWLYGFVDTLGLFGEAGDGYWYWIHTIGGEAVDGSLYECESVPGLHVHIGGDPAGKISNGPFIGPL